MRQKSWYSAGPAPVQAQVVLILEWRSIAVLTLDTSSQGQGQIYKIDRVAGNQILADSTPCALPGMCCDLLQSRSGSGYSGRVDVGRT